MNMPTAEEYAELQRRLAASEAELAHAREREAASAELLQVVAAAGAEAHQVFEKIADSCARLFTSSQVAIPLLREDGRLHLAAYRGGQGERLKRIWPMRLSDSPAAHTLPAGETLHFPCVTRDIDNPGLRAGHAALGDYSLVIVPMILDGQGIGTIDLARQPPRAFSDREIALLESFATQAVLAVRNARMFRDIGDALDRQTAMSDVLRVMSASPMDVQPVFDTIVERAIALCHGRMGFATRFDGDLLHLITIRGGATDLVQSIRELFPTRPDEGTGQGRMIRQRGTIQITDFANDERHRLGGKGALMGSGIAVPLLRDGRLIGGISVERAEVGPFPEAQVQLLQAFADQAVIAIENVRLFRETQEALERQTATAEVLRAISTSIEDTAPVFETILDGCERLFGTEQIGIAVVDQHDMLQLAEVRGPQQEVLRAMYPIPLSETVVAEVLRDARTVHFPEVRSPEGIPPMMQAMHAQLGDYSTAVAPMMRESRRVGAMWVLRSPPRPFAEADLEQLASFASQAVIAIENARLFRETREALERQTATAEVLRVISSSVADSRPVFEKVLDSCVRLFGSTLAGLYLLDDHNHLHMVAQKGKDAEKLSALISSAGGLPLEETVSYPAIQAKRAVHYPDWSLLADQNPWHRMYYDVLGNMSAVVAPLMWQGRGLGSIGVIRAGNDRAPFSESEIDLLTTFADQSVIAIENARLFNETREALERQTATAEVLRVISSSVADTQPVFEKILDSCERLFATEQIGIYMLRADGRVDLAACRGANMSVMRAVFPLPVEDTATGLAIQAGKALHYPELSGVEDLPAAVRAGREHIGNLSMLCAPLMWEGRGVGSITAVRYPPQPFTERETALLETFADQAVIAIENTRLFRELEDRTRELAAANQHKSEFLANMSHELRTPLNAIIGFSEVLVDRMFGDLNDKQDEYLRDIFTSGKHLLSLINDILDLSKIEAGRMDLELETFDVAAALDNTITLIRERAQRHGIDLAIDIPADLGVLRADQRKLKQIMLNLLSNAVKFTPDGGRVGVRASLSDNTLTVTVSDTGIGIAREDQATVFEAFRQVGGNYTNKQEGTGLGLALTRRFVELHGGRLALESEPGCGSTFTFTLPGQA